MEECLNMNTHITKRNKKLPYTYEYRSLVTLVIHVQERCGKIFGFLFVICHHFLNSTRSSTICISRFTEEE